MEITQYIKNRTYKVVVVSGCEGTDESKAAAREVALAHAGEREGSIFGSNSHFGRDTDTGAGVWRFEFWTD